MKFETPATSNPIDQLKVVGQPVSRIDGPLKTTGTAPYAYDRYDVVPNQAYGYVLGSAIAKGRIVSMNLAAAKAYPGVITIVTAENAGKLAKGLLSNARTTHDNAFKIQLVERTLASVLNEARNETKV